MSVEAQVFFSAAFAAAVVLAYALDALGASLRSWTEVPYFRMLRRPVLFGGLSDLVTDAVVLLVWLILVVLYASVTTFLVSTGASSMLGPGAVGELGPPCVSTVIATLCCRATKVLWARLSRTPPKEVLTNQVRKSRALAMDLLRPRHVAIRALYAIPATLLQPYNHFIQRGGVIKAGCIQLLHLACGGPFVLRYFESSSVKEEVPDLAGVDASDAVLVLTALVDVFGYRATRSRLVQFSGIAGRRCERTTLPSPVPAQIDDSGTFFEVAIRDVSRDGTGIGVELPSSESEDADEAPWIPGKEVTLAIEGHGGDEHPILTRIVHCTRLLDKKLRVGMQISRDNRHVRNELLRELGFSPS